MIILLVLIIDSFILNKRETIMPEFCYLYIYVTTKLNNTLIYFLLLLNRLKTGDKSIGSTV